MKTRIAVVGTGGVGGHHGGGKAEAPAIQLVGLVPFERDGTAGIGAGADHLLGQQQVDAAGSAAAAGLVDERAGAGGIARQRSRAQKLTAYSAVVP